MNNKGNVLVVGREVSDFMCPLFKGVHERSGLNVDLLELRDNRTDNEEKLNSFNQWLDVSLKLTSYSKPFIVSALFSNEFLRTLLKTKKIKESLKSSVLTKRISEEISGYDVVNIHFLTPELFLFTNAFSKAKKLVVTFWGSDLFHNNADFQYEDHKKIVELADVITLHNKEMESIFLSKFGRDKASKVKLVLPVSDSSYLEKYLSEIPNKQAHLKQFKERYSISSDKRIVTVGHSGHSIDRHIPILEELGKLKNEIKKNIFLVLPCTYGLDDEAYYNGIVNACQKSNIEYKILRDFLPFDQLIELRMASEVLVRLSSMDAFSLSLSETLCAGNVVIAGTWLPYGKLRGGGVYFEEVYEFSYLSESLTNVIDNYEECSNRCTSNPKKVVEILNDEKSIEKFHSIFNNE